MTRTGRSPRLCAHLPEPFVDMHGADARHFGLRSGRLVRIVSRWGRMVARLRISGELPRGTLFVPIHWSGASSSNARVGALVSPSVDPVSGEPEFKSTPARVEPYVVNWYGFLLARAPVSRGTVSLDALSYWACVEGGAFRRYEIAGRAVPARWPTWARALLGAEEGADWIDYEDAHAGTYRAALLRDDRLEACLFIAPRPELPSGSWLAALFDRPTLSAAERAQVLAARSSIGMSDGGPLVCACAGVGRRAVESAIAAGSRDLSAIGRSLSAGVHCGSCRPELRRLIQDAKDLMR
jgi:assimilatory nitrate reductase catalytic subunit